MDQVQAKLAAFKAKLDTEEATAEKAVLARMDTIKESLSKTFKDMQDKDDACFSSLHSSMKQIVNDSVITYAAQYFPDKVKEAVHAEIVIFAVDKLREHMNAHLVALLSTQVITKATDL